MGHGQRDGGSRSVSRRPQEEPRQRGGDQMPPRLAARPLGRVTNQTGYPQREAGMVRGGFRQHSGRTPDSRALIREAAHMLAGGASLLYDIARNDLLPIDREAVEKLGRIVIRDAMAAKRRLDRALRHAAAAEATPPTQHSDTASRARLDEYLAWFNAAFATAFCPQCGAPAAQGRRKAWDIEMVCPGCGEEIWRVTCWRCGRLYHIVLRGSPPPEKVTGRSPSVEPRNKVHLLASASEMVRAARRGRVVRG